LFAQNKMSTPGPAARGAAQISLAPEAAEALRARLPAVAEQTVRAVIDEVPSYAAWLTGDLRVNIEQAVRMALAGFVRLAASAEDADPGTPLQPALSAAYELGRGEAREQRTMDALLAAYRVGARVAWRELSRELVDHDVGPADVAAFAELVFAYIDELSAASLAGHTDEGATTGRVRERYLERLAGQLVAGAPADILRDAAERADWEPPETLTAVLLPSAQARRARSMLDLNTLTLTADMAGGSIAEDDVFLLVPAAGGARRAALLRALAELDAVVGPARNWTDVAASCRRALGARAVVAARGPVDTESHLATLVVRADAEVLADLRSRVLAPFAELRPATAERLADTLRSWLLHQGRRDAVAAELMVHPQTVRYRMSQIRDLLGDRLDDPAVVFELVVALGSPAGWVSDG
jgi:hypothetical protein